MLDSAPEAIHSSHVEHDLFIHQFAAPLPQRVVSDARDSGQVILHERDRNELALHPDRLGAAFEEDQVVRSVRAADVAGVEPAVGVAGRIVPAGSDVAAEQRRVLAFPHEDGAVRFDPPLDVGAARAAVPAGVGQPGFDG